MAAKREIKVAIVVGIIMLTICAVAFIINYRNLHPKIKTFDLKVYKHIMLNEQTKQGTYVECTIPTDELAKIDLDFRKIMNLDDKHKVEASIDNIITGNYKIVSGVNYIAFDVTNKKLVYRNDTTALYKYNSDLYKNVEELCSNITKDSIAPVEEETPKEEETKKTTKETTKNTKKDTKKTNKK